MKKAVTLICFLLTVLLANRIFAHFSGGDFSRVLALIGGIPARTWAILVPLTIAYYALDWMRFKSVLAVLGYPLSYLTGLSLTCVSYFVVSLSPMSELHTPAMVFMLSRRSIPIPAALAASVTKSLYMVFWISAFAYTSLLLAHDISLPPWFTGRKEYIAGPLLAGTGLLAVMIFMPWVSLPWIRRRREGMAEGSLKRKVVAGIEQSIESISRIGRSGSVYHWLGHASSIAFLGVYVALGYVLATHFGFEMSVPRAITVFSTSLLVAYASPVPGSMGVTELATSYMLDSRLTAEGMAVSLTLRFLCWYIVTLPGGIILGVKLWKTEGNWSLPRVFRDPHKHP